MRDPDIKLDHLRAQRLGFDEAIYAVGKSLAQLEAIIDDALESQARRLLTRLTPEQHEALPARQRSLLDYDVRSHTAFVGACEEPKGPARVAIVTGGSSDARVSREAARTLAYHGYACLHIADVGVAGLWRLLDRLEDITTREVVIAVAGMEGALPSVIAGLVRGLVIAVPTSVGYGVGHGGQAALASALASCAPGLVTVNIDNGYGAACAAIRALRASQQP